MIVPRVSSQSQQVALVCTISRLTSCLHPVEKWWRCGYVVTEIRSAWRIPATTPGTQTIPVGRSSFYKRVSTNIPSKKHLNVLIVYSINISTGSTYLFVETLRLKYY